MYEPIFYLNWFFGYITSLCSLALFFIYTYISYFLLQTKPIFVVKLCILLFGIKMKSCIQAGLQKYFFLKFMNL